MKVAYILPKLCKTAPINYTFTLVEHLIKYIDIEVFYFDNVVELNFPCPTKQISFKEPIDFDKFDIIHSHGYRPDAYISKFRALIKGKKVSTIHSYINSDLRSTYNILISFVYTRIWHRHLSNMDYVITLTKDMKNHYANYIDTEKLKPIYTGHTVPTISQEIDATEKTAIQQFCSGYKAIGVIANLTKQKGVDQLINAISRDSNYCLLIIGNGKEKKNLEDQARKNNCLNRCLFLGHKKDAFRYLIFVDVYAMSSYQEGFGMVTLEAAQFKKPLLCSDINVFREIFNEETVAYFKKNDAASVLQALNKLTTNYAFYSNNIYNLYCEKYTSERMTNDYKDLYKEITKINI